MRNALLSSVSHDLRTPLAAITGAATSLRDDDTLPGDVRRELAATIAEESDRLNRLVTNLLDMTRLEARAVELTRGWHSVEELIGAALGRLEPALDGRPVHVDVPPSLPLVPLDEVLFEQAIFNLLDNAVKHTRGPIDVSARAMDGSLTVTVADRGDGLPSGDVFRKFARGPSGGSGLGLAIVRAIAEAHGGTATAAPREGGGTSFVLSMPVTGEAPKVAAE
jgi:two-component system sensor histidine kinase KdpD